MIFFLKMEPLTTFIIPVRMEIKLIEAYESQHLKEYSAKNTILSVGKKVRADSFISFF